MDFSRFEAISFDCYGTLIDWETGILGALAPVLDRHGRTLPRAELLRLYSQVEREVEAGPYQPYCIVLEEVVRRIGARLQFSPSRAEVLSLPESLRDWQPFPDTVAALDQLHQRYKLVIISNVDDELFAHSARKLRVRFHNVITAQQVGSYKPSPRNFEYAQVSAGLHRDRWLHTAESLFHDIAPCNQLGIASVWVNRSAGRGGASGGAMPGATPDFTVGTLAELAELALAA